MKTYKITALPNGPELYLTFPQLETLVNAVRFLENESCASSLNLECKIQVSREGETTPALDNLLRQIIQKWTGLHGNDFRKIDAIKELRERTGCGLREAKDQVEAMFDKMYSKDRW